MKIAIAAAVLLLGAGGCSSGGHGARETTSAAPGMSATASRTSAPHTVARTQGGASVSPPPSFDVPALPGAIALLKGNEVAGRLYVDKVTVTKTDNDPNYPTAATNGNFVVFSVRAESGINGLNIDGVSDFYVLVNGRHYDPDNGNAYLINGELSPTTLNAGEHTEGKVTFDLPSQHGLLEYAPGYLGAPLATWKY